jgi:putative sterol carrier protein
VADAAAGFDSAALAQLVRSTPPDQLARGIELNRDAILGEVFRRFPEQLTEAGRRQTAVIQWRISGGSGAGGYDRWFVVIREGRCETGRDLDEKPRVTLTVGPVDFLRLVTANANPTRLFLTGRLRIRGDVPFATRLPQLFAIPR